MNDTAESDPESSVALYEGPISAIALNSTLDNLDSVIDEIQKNADTISKLSSKQKKNIENWIPRILDAVVSAGALTYFGVAAGVTAGIFATLYSELWSKLLNILFFIVAPAALVPFGWRLRDISKRNLGAELGQDLETKAILDEYLENCLEIQNNQKILLSKSSDPANG